MTSLRLTLKLPLVMIGVTVVALLILGVLTVATTRNTAIETARDRLELATKLQDKALQRWAAARTTSFAAIARSAEVQKALQALDFAFRQQSNEGPPAPDLFEGTEPSDTSAPYLKVHATHREFLEQLAAENGYSDLAYTNRSGLIVYTLRKGDDFGRQMSEPADQARPVSVPLLAFDAEAGAFKILVEVVNARGSPLGRLQATIDAGALRPVIEEASGFMSGLQTSMAVDGQTLWQEMSGAPAPIGLTSGDLELGLQTRIGVAGAYMGNRLPGSQVLKPVRDFLETSFGAFAVVALLCVVIAAISARRLVSPLHRVSESLQRLDEQDIHLQPGDLQRGDEIGAIARSLRDFHAARADARELENSNKTRSAALLAMSAATLMLDSDQRIILANPAFEALLNANSQLGVGLGDTPLAGTRFDALHDGLADLKVPPPGQERSVEIEIGGAIYRLHIVGLGEDGAEEHGAVVEWTDITQVRQQAAKLEMIETELATALLDADGRLLRHNTRFCGLFGGDDIGQRMLETILQDPADIAEVKSAVAAGARTSGSYRVAGRRNGESVWVEGTFSPIVDSSGRLDQILFLGLDISAARNRLTEVVARSEALMEAQEHVVSTLRASLKALAECDLTLSIEDPFDARYEELRSDFNRSLAILRDSIGHAVGDTIMIECEATQITDTSTEAAERSEKQSESIADARQALEDVAKKITALADASRQARERAGLATSEAETGSAVVEDAVKAMEEIAQSSERISRIVSVIDDIAFQTNLLALNAGVEAARAGETGKGFAVVASEVRALAQRCSDAAHEINTLIDLSSSHVQRGVDLVGRTGTALDQIAKRIEDVSGHVGEITDSAAAQSDSIEAIRGAVIELDRNARRNAEIFRGTSQIGQSLAEKVGNLNHRMGLFQICDPFPPRAPTAQEQNRKATPQPDGAEGGVWNALQEPSGRTAITHVANGASQMAGDEWTEF